LKLSVLPTLFINKSIIGAVSLVAIEPEYGYVKYVKIVLGNTTELLDVSYTVIVCPP
jgi:hypothetical protein